MNNVLRLLKLEYTKFKKNSVIGLLTLLYVISMPTVIFIGKEFDDIDLPDPLPGKIVFYEFPTVWDYLGYVGNWLSFFFLGLIAVFIVVNEVNYKTFRQNIITGLTRKEYFLAKVYSILAISVLAALYYATVAMGIGLTHTPNLEMSEILDSSWAIPRFFLMTFGYMSFGLFIGFLIRRSGVSVLFYLTYILMFEAMIKWGIHFRLIAKNATINYYPSNCIEDLMPMPLFRFADLIPKKDIDFNFLLNYTEATIGTLVWIVIFLGLSYRSLMKRDV